MSEWYSVVERDFATLEQGEIFDYCPVPNVSLPLPIDAASLNGADIAVRISFRRAILLSQSCDLEIKPGKPERLNSAVLCFFSTLAEISDIPTHPLHNVDVFNMAKRGVHPAYFLMDGFESVHFPQLSRETSFVLFADVFTLPMKFLRDFAALTGPRLRLESPYKEAVACSFGHFFGRVALPYPVDVPQKRLAAKP